MLFDNMTKHNLEIPVKDDQDAPVNIAFLIRYLCEHVMEDKRKELFILDGSV